MNKTLKSHAKGAVIGLGAAAGLVLFIVVATCVEWHENNINEEKVDILTAALFVGVLTIALICYLVNITRECNRLEQQIKNLACDRDSYAAVLKMREEECDLLRTDNGKLYDKIEKLGKPKAFAWTITAEKKSLKKKGKR